MDWEPLIMAGAGVIALVVSVGTYLLNRLKKLERDSESHRKEDERAKNAQIVALQKQVTDLADKAKRVDTLESQMTTLLTELAALQEQVTTLKADLETERNEKAKAEARVKELSLRVTELEATAARLTIERDTLATLIRDRMDAGERSADSGVAGEGKPSTQDVLAHARRVNDAADARLTTGTHARTSGTGPADKGAPEVGGEKGQGG